MSSSSGDYDDWLRAPPLPVIPPNAQAVWLNADVRSTQLMASRCTAQMSSFESNTSDVLSSRTSEVGKCPVQVLSNDVLAMSLNGENAVVPPSVFSDDSSPTFFQLLETVSPHVQSVLLEKCTVLELSSLAFVSRSLREGALATMAKRSLGVRFNYLLRCDLACDKDLYVVVMYIDDISDPSRSMSVEFCNSYDDDDRDGAWHKIQKLLFFCDHAGVKRIEFEAEPATMMVDSPNHFAMRSGRITQYSHDAFCVEELVAHRVDGAKMLEFVSPRLFRLTMGEYCSAMTCYDLDHFRFAKESRGMRSSKSIIIEINSSSNFTTFIVEETLKMSASSITFYAPYTNDYLDCWFYESAELTPAYVSLFIEEWLLGNRVIDRVQSCLLLDYYGAYGGPRHDRHAVEFGESLIHFLGELDQPPLKIDFSTTIDDDLKGQLQILDGKMIYEGQFDFCPEGSVIHLTANDGRKLTVVVTKGWDIHYNRSNGAGFIDIFPSR